MTMTMTSKFTDATFVVGTLAFLSAWWALWIRRHTWGFYFEAAATWTVLLNGVGLLMASPIVANTLGLWSFQVTGIGGLSNFLAHLMAIGGMAAFIVHLQIRSNTVGRDPARLHGVIRQRLCLPLTLAINVMLALLVESHVARGGPIDLMTVNCDPWLMAYWVVFCSTILYLVTYVALLLIDLRGDRRSRRSTDVYLVAVLLRYVAIAICIVTRLYNDVDDNGYMWLFASLSCMLFCTGIGWSWMIRLRRWRQSANESELQEIPEPGVSQCDRREDSHGELPPTSGP